jgi:stress response protein YsnF
MAMHEVNIQRLLNELTKEEQEKLTRREEIDVPLWSIVNQHNDETINREHEKILNEIDDLMKKHGVFQKEDQSVTLK